MGSRIQYLAVVAGFVLFGSSAYAQRATTNNANLWISHWGDHRISNRWSLHTEGHWRRADLGRNWQQLLLRPAVNYHLKDHVLFTLGYSFYINYAYGEFPIAFNNWEHHFYQQVQLGGHAIGRLQIGHRFRMEERFIAQLKYSTAGTAETELDHYTYQSRFRYRVWLTLPLGHDRVEPGVFSAHVYDEVFINFGDSQRLDYINQNRISALIGYQISPPVSILFGYLHQVIERPGAANGSDLLEINSTLHIALLCNLDLRKKAAPQP